MNERGSEHTSEQNTEQKNTRDQQFDDGLKIRKQVMGDSYVDSAFANADAFTLPIQEFITRNAWGTVWCQDGMTLKQRSMVTLSMLIALGRSHEIKGHVRGAINNGVTPEELREILLHAAVYCGAPLALEATRSVHEVLKSL